MVDLGTADELTRYEEFNKDFMKRHPDIKVTLQPSRLRRLPLQAARAAHEQHGSDVFYVGDDKIGSSSTRSG
ncbi:hypothetical protein [Microbacterium hydrocarbonoxydans]|uniref:hypothetical protein n=1 Tax=Microbacterium hydrocarbonoxydans TaxID=273678 RepID=UPI00094323EC|nr:hypothetical protein [Microbacterium hydrocarbonoxydans]